MAYASISAEKAFDAADTFMAVHTATPNAHDHLSPAEIETVSRMRALAHAASIFQRGSGFITLTEDEFNLISDVFQSNP